jgi:hypothetical protein
MATKKKWYQGWKTAAGSVLMGIGSFVAALPGDFVVGTYNGMAITAQAVTIGLGTMLTVLGLGGKIKALKE